MSPNSIWAMSLYRGKIWTQSCVHPGRTSCGDESRDQSDASPSHGMLKMVSNPPEVGREVYTVSPSQPLEGTNPADALISDPQGCGVTVWAAVWGLFRKFIENAYYEKTMLNFNFFLHQNWFVLTFYNMFVHNLVWGTKKDNMSVWKEPLSEQCEFLPNLK